MMILLLLLATLVVPLAGPVEAHNNCSLRAPITVFPGSPVTFPTLYGYAAIENCDSTHYRYVGTATLQRRISGQWRAAIGSNSKKSDNLCCNTRYGPDDLDWSVLCTSDGITDRFRILVGDIYTVSSSGNIAHRTQTWIGPVLVTDCAADGQPS